MITECKLSLEEIKALSKKMVLLVDSREKKNKHIMEYFMKHMLSYEIRQLPYGDYSFYLPAGTVSGVSCPLYFHREIVLERKASLEELSGNASKKSLAKRQGIAARCIFWLNPPEGTEISSGISIRPSLSRLPILPA